MAGPAGRDGGSEALRLSDRDPDHDADDDTGDDVASPGAPGAQRLDKWLWYARIVKSRTLAAQLIEKGRVRVNTVRIQKPSYTVKPDDVITASVHRAVRVLKVVATGTRRGPAAEAQRLYEDLTAPVPPASGEAQGTRDRGTAVPAAAQPMAASGRPTKKERRQILRAKGQDR